MAKLEIKIPESGCKDCAYLKKKVIDHNYYGETTTKHVCCIFDTEIKDFSRCSACVEKSGVVSEVAQILKERSES